MVMIGGGNVPGLIYNVGDPLHPALMCSFQNTTAHLFTGDTFEYLRPVGSGETDIVLHSFGSGNESITARLPFQAQSIAWTPQGNPAVYTVFNPQTDQNHPSGTTQVWVYAEGASKELYAYGNGIGDCICRYGPPPQVLAISPDGQYVVSGWLAGKGSDPLAVYRLSDRARVFTAAALADNALWDRTGHRLYFVGPSPGLSVWTPEAGLRSLPGPDWSVLPSLSPDGRFAAFTAYADPSAMTGLHAYAFELDSGALLQLSPSLRSQPLFVRDGWVWYLEEQACADCIGGSQPTGRVMARQMPSGAEQVVTFVTGDDPIGEGGTFGALALSKPEFWPAT